MECTVHRYKYSQDGRRSKLRRMAKEGVLKYLGKSKTHHRYEIINMDEYRKRK